MTTEEAIKVISDRIETGKMFGEDKEPVSDYDKFVNEGYMANMVALETLNEKLEREENKELTLGELLESLSEFVWCEFPAGNIKSWVLLKSANERMLTTIVADFPYHFSILISEIGVSAKFYRYKPKGV